MFHNHVTCNTWDNYRIYIQWKYEGPNSENLFRAENFDSIDIGPKVNASELHF